MKSTGLIFSLFILLKISFAQQAGFYDGLKKINENGREYYIFVVPKGITLYSISKNSGISMDTLYHFNPALNTGLKTGMEIKIPANQQKKISLPVTPAHFIFHTVKQGETLYFISKLYQTTIEKIIEANPEANAVLKPGIILKIFITDAKLQLPDAQEFHYHFVLKGQTLYSISNIYQIKVKEIQKFNPHLETQELTESEIIRIPKSKSKIELEISTRSDSSFYYHIVDKKQTLYAIANLYHVSIDKIIEFNPHLKDNQLKEGETIKIPRKIAQPEEPNKAEELQIQSQENVIDTDTIIIKKPEQQCPDDLIPNNRSISFSLLLSLYTSINDTLNQSMPNDKGQVTDQALSEKIYPRSDAAIEFYEGALMALEVLKSKNISTILHTYDTESDNMPLSSLLTSTKNNKSSFIICPTCQPRHELFQTNTDSTRYFIIPTLLSDYFRPGNNYIFLLPSERLQTIYMLDLVKKNQVDTLIFIYDSTASDGFTNLFRKKIIDSTHIFIKDLVIISNQDTIPETIFHSGSTNYVIVSSEDQAFVTDIIGKLNAFADKYPIELYGRPKWTRFENIDIEYFFRMNTYLLSNPQTDYKKESVKNFIKKFRLTFHYEPERLAFSGFDAIMSFAELYYKKGNNLKNCLLNFDNNATLSEYFFDITNKGIENKLIHVLKFDKDYQIKVFKIYK